MTTRPQDPRLRTFAQQAMCDDPSLSSYEPYEPFPPLGQAPMASPGRAPQSLPPRASQWTRVPLQAPLSEGPRPPSDGTRMVAPVILSSNDDQSEEETSRRLYYHHPPTTTPPNEVRPAEYSPQRARPAMTEQTRYMWNHCVPQNHSNASISASMQEHYGTLLNEGPRSEPGGGGTTSGITARQSLTLRVELPNDPPSNMSNQNPPPRPPCTPDWTGVLR